MAKSQPFFLELEMLYGTSTDIGFRERVAYFNDGQGWLQFICPCGCDREHVIPIRSPRWQGTGAKVFDIYIYDDGTFTLSPSVRHKGCESHFAIQYSNVKWLPFKEAERDIPGDPEPPHK